MRESFEPRLAFLLHVDILPFATLTCFAMPSGQMKAAPDCGVVQYYGINNQQMQDTLAAKKQPMKGKPLGPLLLVVQNHEKLGLKSKLG